MLEMDFLVYAKCTLNFIKNNNNNKPNHFPECLYHFTFLSAVFETFSCSIFSPALGIANFFKNHLTRCVAQIFEAEQTYSWSLLLSSERT